MSPILVVPIFSVLIYLAISSIRFVYSITDRTPPCLMLSRILIFLVFPYLVRIVAVRFLFIFFTIFRSLSMRLLLLSAYSMTFSCLAMLCCMLLLHPGMLCEGLLFC